MSYADAVKKGKKISSPTNQKKNLDILSLRATRPVGGTIYLGPLHSNCDDCESCDTCEYRRGCTDPRCVNGVARVYDQYVSQEQLDEVEESRKRCENYMKALWKREDEFIAKCKEMEKELSEALKEARESISN